MLESEGRDVPIAPWVYEAPPASTAEQPRTRQPAPAWPPPVTASAEPQAEAPRHLRFPPRYRRCCWPCPRWCALNLRPQRGARARSRDRAAQDGRPADESAAVESAPPESLPAWPPITAAPEPRAVAEPEPRARAAEPEPASPSRAARARAGAASPLPEPEPAAAARTRAAGEPSRRRSPCSRLLSRRPPIPRGSRSPDQPTRWPRRPR